MSQIVAWSWSRAIELRFCKHIDFLVNPKMISFYSQGTKMLQILSYIRIISVKRGKGEFLSEYLTKAFFLHIITRRNNYTITRLFSYRIGMHCLNNKELEYIFL